ncbi:GDSL-type esterase/lipase family protein [Pseudodesulfovibrio tunisiensis]|uniref:GDSL-type esterase/lipase family protein n=1 Tax=Pseudodesulfovibrio tunisiensis TaxID=463192 RepID=UPI001FB3F6D4|nr:GDSL-type esterase/lipase family protein [Pseudodesulfovibrio tunisiensis]
MRKLFGVLKQALVFILILAFLLELGSWLYIKYVNPNIPLPTYSFVNAGSKFWVILDEHFGVWHEPDSHYLHNKSCFVVEYDANEHGMRDRSRTLKSGAPRVALLGDSFIEGWGNELPDRLSDRLEVALGREVLNFGTSGGFGTIQEWQQYEHFVARFDHDVVMLGILPHNDFTDNSYEYAQRINSDAYRPYLVGTYPDYDLVYGAESLPDRKRRTPWLKSFDFTLREWSSFYRVMRYLGSFRVRNFTLVPRWEAEFNESPKADRSRYYDFTPREWGLMRYSLERIVEDAGDRPVIVFTIPVHPDFLRYDGTEPPLSENIRLLAESKGFVYVDLLKEMADRGIDAYDIFFVCDNHWSPFGNEVAAGILEPYVRKAVETRSSVK